MRHVTELDARQLTALRTLIDPARVSTGASVRALHVRDISPHEGVLPAAVVFPTATSEVSALLAWCYAEEIPVTPWGAGSSTEGNPVPACGGVVLDMTKMDAVVDIRPADLQADVQPGVLRRALNRRLESHGLFFPPDPGADATIGGMIANNASGVQTVKYGATRDAVMRLVVVLPNGDVIHTGTKARKSSSGYDLTRLFVGSEGTLGVITEATLRLSGLPACTLAATVTFASLEAACTAVAAIIGAGLDPAALELLTPELIALMNREKQLGLDEAVTLFCEFHGASDAALRETWTTADEIARDCGGSGFRTATSREERQDLWRARHEAWETIHRAHPGKQTDIVDVAVPISRMPEMVVFSQAEVDRLGVTGYVFGHAGDGNVHIVMPGDPSNADEWARVHEVNANVVSRAIALGGTCTGEHGIGIGKRCYVDAEHGASAVLMRHIKDLIDPKGLMNPGKMFAE